jgi:hypothetical protein
MLLSLPLQDQDFHREKITNHFRGTLPFSTNLHVSGILLSGFSSGNLPFGFVPLLACRHAGVTPL